MHAIDWKIWNEFREEKPNSTIREFVMLWDQRSAVKILFQTDFDVKTQIDREKISKKKKKHTHTQ